MANEAERLFKIENELGMLKQRTQFLEEKLADLNSLVRSEVMRTLGIVFGQLSESMLTAVASSMRYTAVAISDEEPVNDQTFYAVRTEGVWKYHIMQGEEMKPFNLTGVVEAMREAMIEFITRVPEGVDSVAFNIYKEQKNG